MRPRKPPSIRRVENPVTLAEARERLEDYRQSSGPGPHRASILAEVIWPDARFIKPQGAGAAASTVLKKLGYEWMHIKTNKCEAWGWLI